MVVLRQSGNYKLSVYNWEFIISRQNLLRIDKYIMTFGPGGVALNATVSLHIYEGICILVNRVL